MINPVTLDTCTFFLDFIFMAIGKSFQSLAYYFRMGASTICGIVLKEV